MQNKSCTLLCFSFLAVDSSLLSKSLLIILIDITVMCFLCEYHKIQLHIFSLSLYLSFLSSPIYFNKVQVLSKEVLYQLGKKYNMNKLYYICHQPPRTSLLRNKLSLALLVLQPKCREGDRYSASLCQLKDAQPSYRAGDDTITLKRGKLIFQSDAESHRNSKLTRAALSSFVCQKLLAGFSGWVLWGREKV